MDFDKLDTTTKLCILIEKALAVGAREAQPIADAEGQLATLTAAGRVTLLRVIDETRKGHDRVVGFLADADDADDDGEGRLVSGDALFTLEERGSEPPELTLHDRDVKTWLGPVLLALATKISPDEAAARPD